jgi:hypothetical protein
MVLPLGFPAIYLPPQPQLFCGQGAVTVDTTTDFETETDVTVTVVGTTLVAVTVVGTTLVVVTVGQGTSRHGSAGAAAARARRALRMRSFMLGF